MADRKRLTIQDIAKATGYSTTTISRALSGKGRVPEKTKNFIKNYVEQVNYSPNIVAKSLSTAMTYNIGVLCPQCTELSKVFFFHQCISGIVDALYYSNYDALYVTDSDNGDLSPALERMINSRKVDGVILLRAYEHDKRIEILKQNNISVLLVGRSNERINQINYDHYNMVYSLMTSILLNKKYMKIAYFSGSLIYTVNNDKFEAYKRAMLESGKEESSFMQDVYMYDWSKIKNSDIEKVFQKTEYDLIVCADEESYKMIRGVEKLNHKVVLLECGEVDINDSNIIKGIFCNPNELGKMAAEQIIRAIELNDEIVLKLLGKEFGIDNE